MDSYKKERIENIDKEIAELKDHAIMRARAGHGGSNSVIDALARVEELELEKEDLINGTIHTNTPFNIFTNLLYYKSLRRRIKKRKK